MLVQAIAYWGFFVILIVGAVVSFCNWGRQSARAMGYFALCYFAMSILYEMGFFYRHEDRLIPLVLSAAVLTILYHSLDMTFLLLCAWAMELIMMAINLLALNDLKPILLIQWNLAVTTNYIAFFLLTWNWYGRSDIKYKRLYSFVRPVSSFRQFCISVREKGKELVA